MKTHVMNKNVIHNGKSYPKDSAIGKGDEGFEELCKAGHCAPHAGAVAAEAEAEAPVEEHKHGKGKHK